MAATTRPLLALTASDLMNRDVVTISQDTPLRAGAELFFRRRIGEAAVVDADGRCVGRLSATHLLRWALGEARDGIEDVPAPACPYQEKGRLQTGENAVICTRTQGTCPPARGAAHDGRVPHCRLPAAGGSCQRLAKDFRGRARGAVRRYMTPASTVEVEGHLSALARAVLDVHVPTLIVVDKQHRPIGTVSCLDVLAALARCRVDEAGG